MGVGRQELDIMHRATVPALRCLRQEDHTRRDVLHSETLIPALKKRQDSEIKGSIEIGFETI